MTRFTFTAFLRRIDQNDIWERCAIN